MPAKSEAQRRLAGAALAYKRGRARERASKAVKEMADMPEESLRHFASKHHATPLRSHKR